MALTTGSRLGTYEVVALLGAGGMGEVYRARDPKLNREVAIKVLPEAYASDQERIARFTREAQAVAALKHSGIAGIHELGEADGQKFLVLELIEGDTLADRLKRGAVQPEDALQIAKQILEALEAAHEKGICHRDLKPANIKITPDGIVKVLDFGLAKFLQTPHTGANLTHSPTLSLAGTVAGMILGTAGYMSPEQAKGFEADQRSDIFSFGCILFEMLTGRQAFEAETASEILASVLMREVDLAALPPRLNPRLVEMLRRCLEKNPKKRWHAVGDVRVELEAAIGRAILVDDPRAATAPGRPVWQQALALAAAALVGGLAAGSAAWLLKPEASRSPARFIVPLPAGASFTNTGRQLLTISPDGSNLVFVANSQLWLRPIGGFEAQPIIGAQHSGGVLNPVFSPDGQSLVYYSQSALWRIAVSGGTPVNLCASLNVNGITWDHTGIYFGQAGKGILRVSEFGGTPETIVATAADELADTPHVLNNGRDLLFTLRKGPSTVDWDRADIVVQPVGGGARKVVVSGAADGRYLPTGHLLFARSGVLFAVRFDPSTLTVGGGLVPVIQGVRRAGTAAAQAAVSVTGVLAYIPGPATTGTGLDTDLALFDRKGNLEALKLPPGPYRAPRVSPDGKRIVFENDDPKGTFIQVYDLAGTTAPQRLTFQGINRAPVWSPDGVWVAFQSDREGDAAIFRQRADGSGVAERLSKPEAGTRHIPQSWSPDGAYLLFSVQKGEEFSLWTLRLKDGQTEALRDVQAREAVFSPDGRWIAYQMRIGDQPTQSLVEPFPQTGAKYLVPLSVGAGHPLWFAKGRELIFNTGATRSHLVTVTTTPAFAFGKPVEYPRLGRRDPNPITGRRDSDAMPDGERLIGVVATSLSSTSGSQIASGEIAVVTDWFDELKQRVPR